MSFTVAGYEPQEVASILETSYHIQTRAGLHCAPLMHQALGTIQHGETVRTSCGFGTTSQEIEETLRAIREIAASQ